MIPRTVLVCGDPARGDDGAAALALVSECDAVTPGCRILATKQLDVCELLAALGEGRTVVVDAVRGIPPGAIISQPLASISDGTLGATSTHALPLASAVALAQALGVDLSQAVFVGIGGVDYRLGAPLSEAVVAALPALRQAVTQVLEAAAQERSVGKVSPV